ncbi:MAG: nucleotide exchange factor GrpE [Nitrososphaeraceae archaeon]
MNKYKDLEAKKENKKDDKKIKEDEENKKDDKKIKEDEENTILKEELKNTKSDLQKCINESTNNFNKLKYLMADFDNYRKQADKMIQNSITNNKANIISKFLNIKDDYLRALEIVKKSTNQDETIINGLDSILKNFDSILSSEGIEQIETIGKIFDPNKHDVVSFSHDSDLSENIITQEVRIGYTLDGKVLRPSLVIINKSI